MKIPSLCFVTNTVNQGKKIIYRIPANIPDDSVFENLQEGSDKKPYTSENLIETFLKNTNIFGCIGQNFFDYSLSFIAELFSPNRTTGQNLVTFVVEELKFISHPVFMIEDNKVRIGQNIENPTKSEQFEDENSRVILHSFNTVLVFHEKEENVKNLKEALQFFSKSLGFEEKNHNFVSKQIYKVFKHNYEFQNSVKNLLKDYNKSEPLKEDTRKTILTKIRELSEEYRKKVELFNLLEDFYKSIINIKPTVFKMDNIKLRTFKLYPKNAKILDTSMIQPFQTILIKKKVCHDQIELDSNPRFQKFIEQHNPKKSFLEMSVNLDLALDEILLYAAHLVNWQAGKVINVISKESVYGINSELDRELLNEELVKKFYKKFKTELVETLNAFAKPLAIAKIREKLSMDSHSLFKLVTWFLKYSYLIEFNYYIYINCPKEVFRANISQMKGSHDEKKRLQGDILEKVAEFSCKKVSLNQISFEYDIPKEKLYKVIFVNKGLLDYYLTE